MFASVALLIGVVAVSSFLLTPLVCRAAVLFGMFDHPGPRKIHARPIPRLGGVCVFASALIAIPVVTNLDAAGATAVVSGDWIPLLLGCVILFLVGLWDDLWHLSVVVKLIGQTAASLIPILWGIRFEHLSLFDGSPMDLGAGAFPLTFLWVIFITNAWNLIDGLDGLSAGLAVIAAGTFAVLVLVKGDFRLAVVPLVVIGASAGFLWHNFHPANIFLGDSGSLLLGYVLAVTAVMGSIHESTTWPLVVPLLVLGIPILDTVFALVRRLREGMCLMYRDREASCLKRLRCVARVFQADQHHIHHRLLDRGFSHRGTVLVLYGFSFLLAVLAIGLAYP